MKIIYYATLQQKATNSKQMKQCNSTPFSCQTNILIAAYILPFSRTRLK